MLNRFRISLTRFELFLWLTSMAVVAVSYIAFQSGDMLSLIASLIGVTALIFVAKGHVLGQILTIVFAVFYGVISWAFRYYGEVITYLCMTAPMALLALITWLRFTSSSGRWAMQPWPSAHCPSPPAFWPRG